LARMLKQTPYDPWASEAQERAQLLLFKHPELMKALTSPAPSAAPSGAPAGFSVPEAVKQAGSQPGARPAPGSTNAPPGNHGLNLLTIPPASSNSTGKP
jgi:hypothetical protein